jgi:hypothetical protein
VRFEKNAFVEIYMKKEKGILQANIESGVRSGPMGEEGPHYFNVLFIIRNRESRTAILENPT